MSIENEIAGLTQSTTDLLEAVNTKKSTLDTAVSNAQTAVTDATSQVSLAAAEKVGAQTARDTAESFKDQAYTYSQSAASAVAYQDLTAIAETKSESAVDVFVYDTTKDSDGGAWRQRTQHTSWYNETLNTATRGSRKEFPAVAVIVAESGKVTIYDGDDPALPLWMRFNVDLSTSRFIGSGSGGSVSAVTMLNGKLCASTTGSTSSVALDGLAIVDFISDTAKRYNGNGLYTNTLTGIVDRNSKGYSSQTANRVASRAVNDVAMTVLPDAPIDPATGLPIPTIAVATDGGVSVIKDDGSVVDITHWGGSGYNYTEYVEFLDDYVVFTQDKASQRDLMKFKIPDQDTTINQNNAPVVTTSGGRAQAIKVNNILSNLSVSKVAGDSIVAGVGGYGFANVIDSADYTETLFAKVASTYNTGWMNGDIKLATLSDTDDTDLVGSELVTNGTFDTDISGWSSQLGGILTHTGSAIQVQSVGNNSLAYQTITADLSKEYIITADLVSGSGAVSVGGNFHTFTNGKLYAILPAGRLNNKVDLSPSANTTAVFDNISVRLAEPDRSVNNNGLQVFGTVQKNPVATGADLVAYSGFSFFDYLRQPHNSDLDFGTGDFCIMGWINPVAGATQGIVSYGDSSLANGHLWFGVLSQNTVRLWLGATGYDHNITTADTVSGGVWNHLAVFRQNGVVYIYINGKLSTSNSLTNDFSNSIGYLSVGVAPDNTTSNPNSKLALLRISATAPTAEQIEKIYNDEKVLFQEGAQATLYGTSDAVTALAYDDTTELLHVGTSGGRSVFQGLKRVDNTTDAVGTAISASNNLVVEE